MDGNATESAIETGSGTRTYRQPGHLVGRLSERYLEERIHFMKSSISITAVLLGLASVSGLLADNLAPPCVANTLAAYENSQLGVQCSVGILNFSDFSFSATGSSTDLLTDSEIEVTPVTNGILGGGFALTAVDPVNAPFAVASGQTATYVINWRFVIDPGPRGSGADLGLDPPFGDVSITQGYCADSFFTTNDDGTTDCSTFGNSAVTSNPQSLSVTTIPQKLFDSIIFDPAILNFASVRTTINLIGDAGSAGFDSISGSAVIVDSTPEPFSFLLGAGGLLGIGLLRKRQTIK